MPIELSIVWRLKINLVSSFQNLKYHHHKSTPNSGNCRISAERGTRLSDRKRQCNLRVPLSQGQRRGGYTASPQSSVPSTRSPKNTKTVGENHLCPGFDVWNPHEKLVMVTSFVIPALLPRDGKDKLITQKLLSREPVVNSPEEIRRETMSRQRGRCNQLKDNRLMSACELWNTGTRT